MRTLGPRAILSIAVVLAILSYAAYTFISAPGTVNLPYPPTRFTVDGRTFGITYVATSQSDREAGLTNRKITNSTTMLFVFPSYGVYPFWMSTVNSSLDIIWLNVTGSVGRVVYIERNVPVCTSSCPNYTPTAEANWVLEAKGGFSETYGVTLGTTVGFS